MKSARILSPVWSAKGITPTVRTFPESGCLIRGIALVPPSGRAAGRYWWGSYAVATQVDEVEVKSVDDNFDALTALLTLSNELLSSRLDGQSILVGAWGLCEQLHQIVAPIYEGLAPDFGEVEVLDGVATWSAEVAELTGRPYRVEQHFTVTTTYHHYKLSFDARSGWLKIRLPEMTGTVVVIDPSCWFLSETWRIEDLLKLLPTSQNWDELGAAADLAALSYLLVSQIVDWARSHEIPVPMTVADAARKLWTHCYLQDPIPRIPGWINRTWYSSYWGGKIRLYPELFPEQSPEVWAYDLNSAFAAELRRLPAFTHGEWMPVTSWQGVESHGVYQVSGEVSSCVYGSIRDRNGHWLGREASQVQELAMTSVDIAEATRAGELRVDRARGAIWMPDDSDVETTDLTRCVDYLYARKSASTDHWRGVYSKMLQSLYGKFVEKRYLDSPDGDLVADLGDANVVSVSTVPRILRTGGLWHPAIAALTTAAVRARLHQIEHEYGVIETRTDSVFALQPLDQALLGGDIGQWRFQGHGRRVMPRSARKRIVKPRVGAFDLVAEGGEILQRRRMGNA